MGRATAALDPCGEERNDRDRQHRRLAYGITQRAVESKFARRLAQQGFTSDRLFSDYMAVVTIVAPALITPTIARDPSDDALLAAALGAGADLIVSGDAHLRNLKSFHGIEIVTATMADNRINTGG